MREGKAVQVWLPPEIAEKLAALARQRERSLSAEVRVAIRKHLYGPEDRYYDSGRAA